MFKIFENPLFVRLWEKAAESEKEGLKPSLDLMKETSIFISCLPKDYGGEGLSLWDQEACEKAFYLLRRLGYINLSLARIFEGHLNAIRLISIYAEPALKEEIFQHVRNGALLGVWGADMPENPLRYREEMDKDGHAMLTFLGKKRFASGLGLIDFAVVSAKNEKEQNFLAVLNVQDKKRQDFTPWENVSGMLASVSGVYDFTDLQVPKSCLIGDAESFYIEPHFEGGIWRYCTVHLGASSAIIDEWRKILQARDRLHDPIQRFRLGKARALNLANASMVYQAMKTVEGYARQHCSCEKMSAPAPVSSKDADHRAASDAKSCCEKAVSASLLAREITEESCVKIMVLCEKSLGMEAYFKDHRVESLRRDLSFFIRQACPDRKLQKAEEILENTEGYFLW